ncbi:hypothetical protein BDK51DRAFT_50930 [Blyttiomyces helicus]|uniref:Uncharacterized protein n=1 Tax=Blyttiomyces helicus TaxID=388810 RepID=A0A4P9WLW5_9FUNG|nr:hypothetical protein BDK51DRAFT_50930 [Blyttiomyces helicus]|eukprot:RKO94039.1 hypothetical protein BDK51DRAFT_50930 [Blyttiomyces helicus]
MSSSVPFGSCTRARPQLSTIEAGRDIVLIKHLDGFRSVKNLTGGKEGGDDGVEVGVVGRYRHLVLEADVVTLVGSLGEQDLCLVLKPILERLPEVEGVSCLEVLGLERLRDVVADEDEGLRVLFRVDGMVGVRGLNGALAFFSGEVGTDVENLSHVVAAIEPELCEPLLGVGADARDSGDGGGHYRQVVKCREVPRWGAADNVL